MSDLTSDILRSMINTAWDRVENYKIEGNYVRAIAEEYAIPDLEKAYTKAVQREKKESRKGWWGR